LRTLHRFLKDQVGDRLTYLHLLPFYPSTSDDGFAVEDFREVRGDLGGWQEVRELAADYRLVFDGVINHVSASSGYMKGYCAGDPDYADFFLALDPATDTSKVLRTRNLPLLHDYKTHAGTKWLWTTFSRDQVDLNFANPAVLLEILDVLLGYAENGAAMIRLDAIPYLWKQLGTTCAHLPQTHELIKLIRDVFDAVAPHVILLTETNVPHQENVSYFGDRGDEAQMIYNFSLAPLILWSLHKGDARVLSDWARGIDWISQRATYLNITATHDGIGMRPTEGILSEPERAELVQLARNHGGDITGKRNADGSISPYELNLNYFDAVNDPRANEPEELQIRRFVVSQAIPMALMGIPGIYLHSLLGSRNDYEGVISTGRARSINREQLRRDRLEAELAEPQSRRDRVFSEMKRLLAIRSQQSAFHPDAAQEIADLRPELFVVLRQNNTTGQRMVALHNVTARHLELPFREAGIVPGSVDTLSGEVLSGQALTVAPYQVRWISQPWPCPGSDSKK
jgi:sucrose phosphorylase